MSEVRADEFKDAAGTGAPNFPNGISDNGVTLAEATSSVLGKVLKNRWQRKYLQADEGITVTDIATNGDAANNDFHFTGLTIGLRYRLTVHPDVISAGAGTQQTTFNAIHNGSIILESLARNDNNTSGSNRDKTGTQTIFTAVTTTVTFDFTEAGATTLFGNGTAVETWIMIEELNNYETESSAF